MRIYRTFGENEYVSIAERKTGKQVITDCLPTSTLVLDIDRDDPLIEEIPCSKCVWSGHGYHLYYYLDTPLTRYPYQKLYKALARYYGGDMQCSDISRLIRVIGSTNEGIVCRVLHESGRIFSLEELYSMVDYTGEVKREQSILTKKSGGLELNTISKVYALNPLSALVLTHIQKYKGGEGIYYGTDLPVLTRNGNKYRRPAILAALKVLTDNQIIYRCRKGWIVPSWGNLAIKLNVTPRFVYVDKQYLSDLKSFKTCVMGLFGVQKIPCSNQTIASKLSVCKRTVIRNRKKLMKETHKVGLKNTTCKVLNLVTKFSRTMTLRLKNYIKETLSCRRALTMGNSQNVTLIEGFNTSSSRSSSKEAYEISQLPEICLTA